MVLFVIIVDYATMNPFCLIMGIVFNFVTQRKYILYNPMWRGRMWRNCWEREEMSRELRRIFGFLIDLLDRVEWQRYFLLSGLVLKEDILGTKSCLTTICCM